MTAKNETKLTEWFPPEVTPSIKGFYEREYDSEWLIKHCDMWDGKHWILMGVDGTRRGPSHEHRRWRGLAENPNQEA